MEKTIKSGLTAKKLAILGLMLAFALILSYVEFLIPFSFGIPGVKLGLANAAVLLALYLLGWKSALLVSVLRILLSALLFGSVLSLAFSLAGGLLSFFVMALLKYTKKFHPAAVSAAGGFSHNLGQLIAAAFLVQNLALVYYLPVLLFFGLLTGLMIGIICQEILLRQKFMKTFK